MTLNSCVLTTPSRTLISFSLELGAERRETSRLTVATRGPHRMLSAC